MILRQVLTTLLDFLDSTTDLLLFLHHVLYHFLMLFQTLGNLTEIILFERFGKLANFTEYLVSLKKRENEFPNSLV